MLIDCQYIENQKLFNTYCAPNAKRMQYPKDFIVFFYCIFKVLFKFNCSKLTDILTVS